MGMAASSTRSARFASQCRVVLPGSERKAFSSKTAAKTTAKAHAVASAASGRLMVSVILKPKQPIDTKSLGTGQKCLTRAQYAARYCAPAAAVKLVKAFAKEFGLEAEAASHAGRCTLHLSGTVAAMEKAFGVTLQQHVTEAGKFRVREGAIHLPEELAGQVLAVLGLDTRPQAKPQFRIAKPSADNVSYTPVQVAELYGFPSGATATGQTIGLIELGGGYRAADITDYFGGLGLVAPKVTAVSVDKGKNTPGSASGADGEVMLDIEVSGAVATGAKIAVYFAPNTDQGFIDAVTTAVHDTTNKPSVISISWGGPESSWTGQSQTALDAACQAAALVGVTITVAAGDNGSSDGATGNNVDFPASSPHVLACGGTTLEGSGETITSEVVWNEQAINEGATGGGVSTVFALPTWQKSSKVPAPTTSTGGRGVPDVAGNADPATGYTIRVDGETMVIGGTSAVAPLWAGLIALANAQNKTPAGFVNPTLYGAVKAFRDITQGNNGAFSAGPGWDACTGLGSPIGIGVVAALGGTGASKKGGKSKGTRKTVKK
jgi:kumamolisin